MLEGSKPPGSFPRLLHSWPYPALIWDQRSLCKEEQNGSSDGRRASERKVGETHDRRHQPSALAHLKRKLLISFRRHIVIAAEGIKSCYFLLVLSSHWCHGEKGPTPAGTCSKHACSVFLPGVGSSPSNHALGMKGLWGRTHDPHPTISSRNLLCPMSHPLCVSAWHPCCRHSLRFTPLIASYRCPMADCCYSRQTSPSQWHPRSLPIISCALDLQSAELAPVSPGEKTLTPNCSLPAAK